MDEERKRCVDIAGFPQYASSGSERQVTPLDARASKQALMETRGIEPLSAVVMRRLLQA